MEEVLDRLFMLVKLVKRKMVGFVILNVEQDIMELDQSVGIIQELVMEMDGDHGIEVTPLNIKVDSYTILHVRKDFLEMDQYVGYRKKDHILEELDYH